MKTPEFTLRDYETQFGDRHLLHGVVAKWAKERPEATALISSDGKRTVTWGEFEGLTTSLAKELKRRGLKKGEYLVTLLPFTVEHVLLEYACFKIGVIVAPLDLRLTPHEVLRALEVLQAKSFVSLGVKGPLDLRGLWQAVAAGCPWVEHLIVLASDEPVEGTEAFAAIAGAAWGRPDDGAAVGVEVSPDDGALVIFTTGSTGSPKPALLSHKNITVQNMCMCGSFFGGDHGTRVLVNLPPSHVGGQTEALMSILFGGGSCVLLEVFDAARSMRAIAQHKVEILGQIPAMYEMEWMLKDYASHDISNLGFAAYGGNSVTRAFVDKLAGMAPRVGTGLGLTECAGFCTYEMAGKEDRESILTGLGVDMPVYPCTIRQEMREDGAAGDEVPAGEMGNVCFKGPQTFLGYVNDPEATARAISKDGFLYTGDLGYIDKAGLHLTGRAKWVIKSFGYQVFPGDVERHVCAMEEKVANCVVVGVAHKVAHEGVVAVVEKKPAVELERRELDKHARNLPTYMRPRHWIILEAGQMPLNRVIKPDYLRAKEMARAAIEELRAVGEWDRSFADR